MPLRVNGYAVDKIRYNGAIITSKPQRLARCEIDIPNGIVHYKLEGDPNLYELTFVLGSKSITYTWPDGFNCSIIIHGEIEEEEGENESS